MTIEQIYTAISNHSNAIFQIETLIGTLDTQIQTLQQSSTEAIKAGNVTEVPNIALQLGEARDKRAAAQEALDILLDTPAVSDAEIAATANEYLQSKASALSTINESVNAQRKKLLDACESAMKQRHSIYKTWHELVCLSSTADKSFGKLTAAGCNDFPAFAAIHGVRQFVDPILEGSAKNTQTMNAIQAEITGVVSSYFD